MRSYKIRTVGYQKSGEEINVITMRKEISMLSENTKFTAEMSGTSIILTSGTNHVDKKEAENFVFEKRP